VKLAFLFKCVLLLIICLSSVSADIKLIGPFGGAASVVVSHPQRPGEFLIGANNGLLFRSKDVGRTWNAIPFPAQLRGVLHALAIDPDQPDTIWAGLSGEGVAGLWVSQNNGVQWQRITSLTAAKGIWAIRFSPQKPRQMLIGSDTGIFSAAPDRETWVRLSPQNNKELQPVVSLAFDHRDPKVLYAGTPHLPWKSTDFGGTWTSIHSGMLDDSDVFSMQVDHADSGNVFATACSGIYCSRNSGIRWTRVKGPVGASYRTYFVTQHPSRAATLFAGTTRGLIRSDDSGQTWNQLSTAATRSVAFHPQQPETMLIATDDGIFRSENGGASLAESNQGFCNRAIQTAHLNKQQLLASTIYDSAGGLFSAQPTVASTWNRLTKAHSFVAFAPSGNRPSSATRLTGVTFSSLLQSPDGGLTWGAPVGLPTRDLVTGIAEDDEQKLWLTTERSVFSKTANGPWKPVLAANNSLGVVRGVQAVSGVGTVIYGSRGPHLVSETVEKLGNWEQVANPKADILAMSAAGTRMVAATTHGLYLSENKGKNWNLAAGGNTGTIRSVAFTAPGDGQADGSTMILSQFGVLYRVKWGEPEWQKLPNQEGPAPSILQLLSNPDLPKTAFALTNRQGIFLIDLP
jgi:photosystem II stability/assembly factor-like uncharacterized protein